MDNAQMQQLLQSYGAADNPDNQNRIRQHYASDPTAMDRRLYGVKGQSDESGGSRDAMLNAMLDKVIAQSAAPPVNEPLPVSPMVQNATVPTRRSATAGAPPAIAQREQYGPGGSDPLQREVNRNTPSNPNARPPAVQSANASGYEVDPQTSAQGGTGTLDGLDGILPLILGLFGAGAAARAGTGRSAPPGASAALGTSTSSVTTRSPAGQPPIVNPPQLPNANAGQMSLPPPATQLDNRAPSSVTGSPENEVLARKAQHQAELDAANAEGEAIQREMAKQARGKFVPKNAVRNVTGRK